MLEQNASIQEPPNLARALSSITNLLACCWAVMAAYLMYHYLLVVHDARPLLAIVVPLIAVWGTLERKRWGRLTLLGLSKTALLLFILAFLFVAIVGKDLFPQADCNPLTYTRFALALFAEDTLPAFGMLMLALVTRIWLCWQPVIDEFERGIAPNRVRWQKKASLGFAQFLIAFPLIAFWCMGIIFTSMTPLGEQGMTPRAAIERILGEYAPTNSLVDTCRVVFAQAYNP